MLNSIFYSHLYEWYESYHRVLPWRDTTDAYCIWLSEIILQQTRVAQGLEYYMRFVDRWPRVEDLAAADEAEVLREWQGLGYYSRARNLHRAAQIVVEQHWTPFPTRFEDILSLPGIGEYTAGAIASFAYDMPYLAMDGNVYRVLARLLDIDEPFDTTAGKKRFRSQAEQLLDRSHPRLYNSAIMEFGALQCTPVLGDNCAACPLRTFCAAYEHGTAELLPLRKPRPKLRDRWFTYHVYIQNEGEVYTLIRRRENAKDIWFHLYEFPCEEHETEPSSFHLSPFLFQHVLSHQRLHARVIIHKVDKMPQVEDAIPVSWEELDNYAFSKLSLKVIDTLRPTLPR